MTRILICFVLLYSLELGAQAPAGNGATLSMERIFKKPYLAGTRPIGASISPDGKWITFRWDSTSQNKYRNWLMHPDGSGLRMIADTLLGQFTWSPDSKHIACTRKGDIFLTDTSFGTFDRVTKTEPSEGGLTWSPDGKLIAFESDGKLMAMPVSGTGLYELAKPAMKDGSLNLVDFTPDSKRILFTESTDEGLPEFIVPKFTGKDVSTRSFKGGVSKSRIGLAPVDTGKILWI